MMRWLLLALLGFASVGVAAADQPASTLRVEHAWIRLLPAGLPAGGYFVIYNDGDTVRRLAGVTSDAFAQSMLHESVRSSGVERMRDVAGVDIPPHGEIAFAPGGYHLMLMQAKSPLQVNEQVIVDMEFVDGTQLPVTFNVRPANAVDDGTGSE